MESTLPSSKLMMVLLPVALTGVLIISCDDDEKPKTVPVVTTSAVTDISTTSAIGGGEITSNGNSEITASGLVYSSIIEEPTIAEDKTEVLVTSGAFTSPMENLNSGTTYYVRAYAINSIGTGYGEVLSFTTGNAPPIAVNVSITGTVEVNQTLTATYSYSDSENDAQSASTFQWYVANDGTGAGETAIAGATAAIFKIQEAQNGKYIRVGVIPKAAAGAANGVEVKSAFVGAVGEATSLTFMYNGTEVTYGILISSVTNKKWLDRNLGAPNTPASFDDFANYGDLFQWGRGTDGHQLTIRNGNTNDQTMAFNEPESTVRSDSDTPGHPYFIKSSAIPLDWRSTRNSNLWQGVNGVNNPCPPGWRIPTKEEWEAEGLTTIDLAHGQLKLTTSGFRSASSGNFSDVGTSGRFWTSTVVPSATTPTTTYRITITATATTFNSDFRGNGNACRCIKD